MLVQAGLCWFYISLDCGLEYVFVLNWLTREVLLIKPVKKHHSVQNTTDIGQGFEIVSADIKEVLIF